MDAPMTLLSVTKLLILLLISTCVCECMRRDIFSSKTAYQWAHAEAVQADENELMRTKLGNSSCTAVHIEALLRHGARFPGYSNVRRMSQLHKKLKLTVAEKFEFLKDWENEFPETDDKNLVDLGEDEQYELGGRFARRLLDVYGGSLNNVKFVSSNKQRTRESAMAFYEGFTEVVIHEADDSLIPEIREDLLRFHDKCEKYIKTVETNKTFMKEYNLFRKSPEMMKVLDAVGKRLGLKHASLNAGEVKLIYFLCSLEMIIFERDDWCQLLMEDEHEVIEYFNDMRHYWKKAYGHPIMGQMACPLVKSMFTAMDKHISSVQNNVKRRGNVATFYFGHAETLAPLYGAFGLYNDSTPLLSTNFGAMRSRKFKSSHILSFSSNLAWILYNCGDKSQQFPSSDSDYALQLYVNERPVIIPACGDYTCHYADVREYYRSHVDDCDFSGICSMSAKHDEL